jgi:hypothetical protein
MIEFKGIYYKNKNTPCQSVLVQYDGVLLHVWHMANPFHRILASDVFSVPGSICNGKRLIRLPNGAKIETDDVRAHVLLQSKTRNAMSGEIHGASAQRYMRIWLLGMVTALCISLFAYWQLTS